MSPQSGWHSRLHRGARRPANFLADALARPLTHRALLVETQAPVARRSGSYPRSPRRSDPEGMGGGHARGSPEYSRCAYAALSSPSWCCSPSGWITPVTWHSERAARYGTLLPRCLRDVPGWQRVGAPPGGLDGSARLAMTCADRPTVHPGACHVAEARGRDAEASGAAVTRPRLCIAAITWLER